MVDGPNGPYDFLADVCSGQWLGFMVVSPGHFGYLLVGRIGRGLVDAAGGSGRGRVSPSRCNAGGGVGRVHSTMYAPMRDEGGLV